MLDNDADYITIERHARAYILYQFGCILFPDKSSDSVQLIYHPLLGDLERVDEYIGEVLPLRICIVIYVDHLVRVPRTLEAA